MYVFLFTFIFSDPPTMEIVKQINETKHFIIEQIDEGVALCNDDVHGFLKGSIKMTIITCMRWIYWWN
ncbi:conserved hypothetical protein [Theileria equi strain WA]|uniref:General transcription and DNA repair factor IIH subunit TFB5 n=1 Tax=Theileria equi strain WA TaxID=1537102 RepID=L1LDB5_THEEQ|nr:conserved hypothetical protein [Theileria equi strain WA]XP_004832889.1 conserved hypothetical protein [Theileria equi strain WA]EKX73293.1 conserved hypothetical protein [Theileria equi strain WA]EKX73437.1 conserved hypothetical protein [Theileria equi strain WA]|eukprot:XP_004832745.1 conserved hypothetical protein [Theileria equi strain WA]